MRVFRKKMKSSWFYLFLFVIITSIRAREIPTFKTSAMMSSTTNITPDTTKSADAIQQIEMQQSGNTSTENQNQFNLILCTSGDENCDESLDKTAGDICKAFQSSTFDEEAYNQQYNQNSLENFISTNVFCSLAIICNVVTIITIVANPNLRKPFYLSILSLAFADILCIMYEMRHFSISNYLCSRNLNKKMYDVYKYSTKLNGKLNITLLATVRYFMFVFPLKSRAHLRNKYITISSIFCIIFSGIYGYCIVFNLWSFELSKTRTLIIVTDDIALIVFFIVINITFFIHRLNTVKKSRAAGDLKVRMTVIVVFILVLGTVDSIISLLKQLSELPDVSKGLMTFPSVHENLSEFPADKKNLSEIHTVDDKLDLSSIGLDPSKFSMINELESGMPPADKNVSELLPESNDSDNRSDFVYYASSYYYIFIHGINPVLYFFSSPSVKSIFSSVFKRFRKK